MRIVHFAPFAPNACGLYEAARDMVIADFIAGHDVYMIDTGITVGDTYIPGEIGKRDDRGGSYIVSSDPFIVNSADIIVAHSGIPDNWIAYNQAPIIWILHGRPRACFKPENEGRGHSYSLMAQLAQTPRVKKLVTFWPYHVKFWEPIMSKDKLVCFDAPPIDQSRFSPNGPKYVHQKKGKWNILVADNWREDVDTYEMIHGIIEASKRVDGLKVHFCSMFKTDGPWRFLLNELDKNGCLGEVAPLVINMEHRYRDVDFLISPNRIVVRTIGEAMSCGIPVIAAKGCDFVTYTATMDEPNNVADVICRLIEDLDNNKESVINKVLEIAKLFSLERYNQQMSIIYNQIT